MVPNDQNPVAAVIFPPGGRKGSQTIAGADYIFEISLSGARILRRNVVENSLEVAFGFFPSNQPNRHNAL